MASYPDKFENIPNMPAELVDNTGQGQQMAREGRKVVLLGTATDGPVKELVNYNGENIFGDYYNKHTNTFNGATLPRGLDRALKAGADNIALMRISGEYATGELDFNAYKKDIQHQTKEYLGEFDGNDQTTVDLNLTDPSGESYDYVYVDEIAVEADNKPLSGETQKTGNADFFVDSNNGKVIVYKNTTNADADIEITFSEVHASKTAVTEETLTEIVGTNEYEFAHDNIQDISSSEASEAPDDNLEALEITDDDGAVSEDDYRINYEKGILVPLGDFAFNGEPKATYTYEEIAGEESGIEVTATASGSEMSFELNHLADMTSAVGLEADNMQMERGEDFAISFKTDADGNIKSEFTVKPGNIKMGSELYAEYTWNEEKVYKPTVEMKSVYGGELYNEVNVKVKDVLVEIDGSYTTTVETEESLEKISSKKAKFKNKYIVPDSINGLKIVRGGGSETTLNLENDTNINYNTGVVELLNNSMNSSDALVCTASDSVAYKYYNVNSKKLIIEKPSEKVDDGLAELEFEIGTEIKTIGDLVSAVNNHASNNVVRFSVDQGNINVSALEVKTPDTKMVNDSVVPNVFELSGGRDGLDISKEELYEKLEGTYDEEGNKIEPGAYDLLKNAEDIDIVVPLGAYADDELLDDSKDFAEQLATFCAKSFYTNNEIKGYIGTKPLKNPTMLNKMERYNELLNLDTDFLLKDSQGNYIRDKDTGEIIDAGKFMGIVAHDKIYDDGVLSNPSIENGAAAYAGMRSMLAKDNSPTNERVPGGYLPYQYSRPQMNNLIGNKLVVFKRKNNRAYVASGVNAAQRDSGWTRDLTTDIVFDTLSDLRDLYEQYVGKGNSLERRNTLNSDIERLLSEKDTILDSDHEVIMDSQDDFMQKMIVDLELVPMGETGKVHTILSINTEL